ncbi:hypothetical protein RhiXN_03756 [Rhizoctonia solani]|uniref:Uncharacterized protein n=1 Tax=Rhizoctonia solani TaxID=456999 RepID=A0A8H8NM87_9AGAM|nr:uncharacterized protein RhiXN_03756 [Rhizoctonia solani]QRW15755.1 hypothetical protein RhiXN_03756 [Rhizoctonia solani]
MVLTSSTRMATNPGLASPQLSDAGSTKSTGSNRSTRSAGSTGSTRSVRIAEDKGPIGPGQYTAGAEEAGPKKVLKRSSDAPPSVSTTQYQQLRFKCPKDLDFTLEYEDVLMIECTQNNQSFVDQVKLLNRLRVALLRAPTHQNDELIDMHEKVTMSVNRAILKMRHQQLTCYLDFIGSLFVCYIESFTYPSRLDFCLDVSDPWHLPQSQSNMPFIIQFDRMYVIRMRLTVFAKHDDGQFTERLAQMERRVTQVIDDMMSYQAELRERYIYEHRHSSMSRRRPNGRRGHEPPPPYSATPSRRG